VEQNRNGQVAEENQQMRYIVRVEDIGRPGSVRTAANVVFVEDFIYNETWPKLSQA